MSVNFTTGVTSNADVYNAYAKSKTDSVKQDAVKSEPAAVYEKSTVNTKAAYSINKMSENDRAALVQQLKAEQNNRQAQMTSLVQKMMTEQAGAFSGSIWEFLASGDYTVDEAAKKQEEAEKQERMEWEKKARAAEAKKKAKDTKKSEKPKEKEQKTEETEHVDPIF